MQERRALLYKRADQWLLGSLVVAIVLQLLIMASDVQFVTNLAKPKLGSYTIGLWHSNLGYPLYNAFAYIVVVALASAMFLAVLRSKRTVLAGLAFGIFFYGVLFGHILPDVEQNLWAWGGSAALALFGLTMLGDFFGTFVRRSIPDDVSQLSRPRRHTPGTPAGSSDDWS